MNFYKKSIPIAVIGAGVMGENHVRVYRQIRGVEEVYIYDKDFNKSVALAEKYDCIPLETFEEVVKCVKAASIVTPTHHHASTTKFLLKNKINCLVEKPLSDSLESCKDIIREANNNNCILMVGHIERFNPVITALQKVLQEENLKILAIHCYRMSYDSARINDINVVMDLMVHDIDIVCSIIKEPLIVEHVSGVRNAENSSEGHVNAVLRSESNVLISLIASRITANKVRKLDIVCDKALLTIDYIRQELKIFRSNALCPVNQNTFGQDKVKLDLTIEKVLVRNQEPLMAELSNFIQAITNQSEVLVDGQSALRAMELVFAMQHQLSKSGEL